MTVTLACYLVETTVHLSGVWRLFLFDPSAIPTQSTEKISPRILIQMLNASISITTSLTSSPGLTTVKQKTFRK